MKDCDGKWHKLPDVYRTLMLPFCISIFDNRNSAKISPYPEQKWHWSLIDDNYKTDEGYEKTLREAQAKSLKILKEKIDKIMLSLNMLMEG